METIYTTSTDSDTYYSGCNFQILPPTDEHGEKVYPCRCGQVHKGEYALYEVGWHNCFHDAALYIMPDFPTQAVCPECGKVFQLDLKGG